MTHSTNPPTAPQPGVRGIGDLALLTVSLPRTLFTGMSYNARYELAAVTRIVNGVAVDFEGLPGGVTPRVKSRATQPDRAITNVQILERAAFAPHSAADVLAGIGPLSERAKILEAVRAFMVRPDAPETGIPTGSKRARRGKLAAAAPAPAPVPAPAPTASPAAPKRARRAKPAQLPAPALATLPGAPTPAPGRALAILPAAPTQLPATWPTATPRPFGGTGEIAVHLLPSKRSLAAFKAIANRDRFAAGRKAAATRAARLAAAAGPQPFIDWVSARIGTRRWIVGPAKPAERQLVDRIVTPAWHAALREAYTRAHN